MDLVLHTEVMDLALHMEGIKVTLVIYLEVMDLDQHTEVMDLVLHMVAMLADRVQHRFQV